MKKSESGVMLIEALYIIPVFLAVILLVAWMLPMVTMVATVNKAALASMVSMSQDGPYTEIIKYHNSTESSASGIGDLIEEGIGKSLVDKNTTFVDTTRWYHNDETVICDSVPLSDMSQYDRAIKGTVSDYADSIRPYLKEALWAAIAIEDKGFCGSNNRNHSNSVAENEIDSASKKMIALLKGSIKSHDQLKVYLDALKTLCDNLVPISPPNYTFPGYDGAFKANYLKIMALDNNENDSMKKTNHTFYFNKYLTVKILFKAGKSNNMYLAPLWQAQYQKLYLDLLAIYNANDPFYKREVHYPKYDDEAARRVAQTRFKAYLAGQDDKYQKFINRYGITKTQKERLNDVCDSDRDFDFSETKMNYENGKLIFDIKYHTVYGINFFNEFLPRDFHFKGTTKIWSGLGGVKKQTDKRKWTVLDPDDKTPPSWAVPIFNVLPSDYWPYAPDENHQPSSSTTIYKKKVKPDYWNYNPSNADNCGWNWWKHTIDNWNNFIPKINWSNGYNV
ncbi:MAG: hypothetical protein LBN08_06645 [Lactobacillales bacterium]|jgi:hypothetical protein|nr:hypothetical protein [Lactobacillales bacterium]